MVDSLVKPATQYLPEAPAAAFASAKGRKSYGLGKTS